MSTQPAMLRYGGVILGLPQRAAFAAPLSEGNSILLPDNRFLTFNRGVLCDPAREKWVGLEKLVSINAKERELRGQFLEYLTQSLFQQIALHKDSISIEATSFFLESVRRKLNDLNLVMEFTETGWRPGKLHEDFIYHLAVPPSSHDSNQLSLFYF